MNEAEYLASSLVFELLWTSELHECHETLYVIFDRSLA